MALCGFVCLTLAVALDSEPFPEPQQGECPSGNLQLVDGDPRTDVKNWGCCSKCPGGTSHCYEECSCMCYDPGKQSTDIIVVIGSSPGSNEKCVTVPPEYEGLRCDEDAGNDGKRVPTRIESGVHTFKIATPAPNVVCARRTDAGDGSWSQLRLVIKCYMPVCSHTEIAKDTLCNGGLIERWPGPEGKSFDECYEACCNHPECKFFGYWPREGQASLEAQNDCQIYRSCEQEGIPSHEDNTLHSLEVRKADLGTCSYEELARNKRCADETVIRRYIGPEGKSFDECLKACCDDATCDYFASWPAEGQAGDEAVNDCRLYHTSCQQEDLYDGYHNTLYSMSRGPQDDEQGGAVTGAIVASVVSVVACGAAAILAFKRFAGKGSAVAASPQPKSVVAPQQIPVAPRVEQLEEESLPVAVAVPINPQEASGACGPVCPNCENKVDTTDRFCNHCGAATGEASVLPTEPDM